MANSPNPTSSQIDSTATGIHTANYNPMDSIVSLNLPIAIKLNESSFSHLEIIDPSIDP
jgi:hypothetical protein